MEKIEIFYRRRPRPIHLNSRYWNHRIVLYWYRSRPSTASFLLRKDQQGLLVLLLVLLVTHHLCISKWEKNVSKYHLACAFCMAFCDGITDKLFLNFSVIHMMVWIKGQRKGKQIQPVQKRKICTTVNFLEKLAVILPQ